MRIVTFSLWLLVTIGGLFTIRSTNLHLVEARAEYGITQANPLINAPPLVVFTTVALGGFRGIIADMLWMRSARLQYEGKFFELVQLADWITKLEPRFTEVWAYHAWNLSYNISILFPNHADRWRWVHHGFSMLRDEGLLYNPGEPRLLYELGWIFQHKIGGNSDDAHMYYKQAWAMEMQELFGGGRPSYDHIANDAGLRNSLIQQYKLDPAAMQEIDRIYGPLDWRLPQAHAIYWATKSKAVGGEKDIIFANRMIYQSMTDAFRRGRLSTGKNGNLFIPSPYLELLPYVLSAYETVIDNSKFREIAMDGYLNFLSEAVILLYTYNHLPEAQDILNKLKSLNSNIPPETDITEFVFQTYTAKGMAMENAEVYALLESTLYQSEYWRIMEDPDRAAGLEQLAQLVWNRYTSPQSKQSGLPPLDEIRDAARQQVHADMEKGHTRRILLQ